MTTFRISYLLSVLALVFAYASLRSWAQGSSGNADLVELTKTDLFSSPNWAKKTIAIYGFTLGSSGSDASRIADAANLTLVPHMPGVVQKSPSPCFQETCDIYGKNSPWIGVSLSFDAAQRVNKIAVGTSVDEIPEVKRASVIRFFRGRTAQFFNDYTDAFREQLFGHAEGKITHDIISGKEDTHFGYIEYDYPNSGAVVHVTVATGDPKPLDIELDFVARQ
jgi:hypothetical protein